MARLITVGKIVGPFGVKGWVKVQSYTDPLQNILRYSPWVLTSETGVKECRVIDGKPHGNVVVARVEGVVDRDQALALQGQVISVPRYLFSAPEKGQYYWVDLIGLQVKLVDGETLGEIMDMMETGANDVMVVSRERERLIPFILGDVVKDVQIDDGYLVVDWDPDF